MRRRGSGILLHITSLPSDFGLGDLGPGARRFADFLAGAAQSVWQVLPLGPTSGAIGNSPYSSFSAFAGNPLLISPDDLVRDGFLEPGDVEQHRRASQSRADYGHAFYAKSAMLEAAYSYRKGRLANNPEFEAFCEENKVWLEDYALFVVLKAHHQGLVWTKWPEYYRDRDENALREFRNANRDQILAEMFSQFLFFRQWAALRKYCTGQGVFLVGDAPIYVLFDSADVWANPQYFKLDEAKQPTHVAGVPPDYFSETGQLWGNPVYNWDALAEDGFAWWIDRVGHNLRMYDLVRIDHFRGFAGYWEVPAGEETAMNGQWVDAPGMEFFEALSAKFSHLPIIAEDLGVITPDVRELRDTFGLPGMRIVQFSFGHGMGKNPDAVHNHVVNSLAYTGTHDNNTARGWYAQEISAEDRERLEAYLGHPVTEETVAKALIRLAMGSVSQLAVMPMQDLLNLPAEARMNTPSKANGNWEWRLAPEELTESLGQRLLGLTELFGRA